MRNLLTIPYKAPFVRYIEAFDKGFYVDFPKQLEIMRTWLEENDCKTTLDIGALTGGCIEFISKSGIRMDGVQYTPDLRNVAARRLRNSRVESDILVSGLDEELRLPQKKKYDGIVDLGWFNLPYPRTYMKKYLKVISRALETAGVFLFDFFEFDNVVVSSPEVLRVGDDIQYLSYSELLAGGKTLRKYHFWIVDHKEVEFEIGDLVDRTFSEVNSLLEHSGLRMVKSIFMQLNYPRHFCMARKIS